MQKIKKAIIPVAGYGTRFLPITKSIPKEMLPIVDMPVIEYVVQEAIDSGIEEIIFIISSQKNAIFNYFGTNLELEYFLFQKNKKDLINIVNKKYNAKFIYINQTVQLGLGHAILLAKDLIKDEPFAVLLGDDIYRCKTPALKQLIKIHDTYNTNILGCMEVLNENTNKYGISNIDTKISNSLYKINSIVEKPNPKDAPSNIAVSGRYILYPQIFKYLLLQEKNKTGEIELTDAIDKSIKDINCYSYIIDGKRYDTGSKIGYLESIIDYALDRDDVSSDLLNIMKNKIKENK